LISIVGKKYMEVNETRKKQTNKQKKRLNTFENGKTKLFNSGGEVK